MFKSPAKMTHRD